MYPKLCSLCSYFCKIFPFPKAPKINQISIKVFYGYQNRVRDQSNNICFLCEILHRCQEHFTIPICYEFCSVLLDNKLQCFIIKTKVRCKACMKPLMSMKSLELMFYRILMHDMQSVQIWFEGIFIFSKHNSFQQFLQNVDIDFHQPMS